MLRSWREPKKGRQKLAFWVWVFLSRSPAVSSGFRSSQVGMCCLLATASWLLQAVRWWRAAWPPRLSGGGDDGHHGGVIPPGSPMPQLICELPPRFLHPECCGKPEPGRTDRTSTNMSILGHHRCRNRDANYSDMLEDVLSTSVPFLCWKLPHATAWQGGLCSVTASMCTDFAHCKIHLWGLWEATCTSFILILWKSFKIQKRNYPNVDVGHDPYLSGK